MRILLVTGEFPPMQGGVGDYTREIGLALADLGCQVHVLTSVQAGEQPGLTVHPIVERWSWSVWGTLLDLVRRHQPDVVHLQYQAAAYAMHPAINLWPRRLRLMGSRRPRSAVTFHDLKVPYLFPKAGRLRRWVVNELARNSDAAITTNREDYIFLGEQMGSGSGGPRLSLIPIGSNIAPHLPDDYDRDAWRARWGTGPDGLLLCFFGFVNDRKGVDTLLHALNHLRSDVHNPIDARLLMIGGQTGASDPTNVAYLARIENMVAQLGLQDRVLWTGYIPPEEVSASFLAADLCLLPFRDGVSFLHGTFHAALAHGVPIITTHPRVFQPELEDRSNIFLVPPEQPQALAEAIAQLAADPELRHKLAQEARILSQRFRWDSIAADTLGLYRTLVAG